MSAYGSTYQKLEFITCLFYSCEYSDILKSPAITVRKRTVTYILKDKVLEASLESCEGVNMKVPSGKSLGRAEVRLLES